MIKDEALRLALEALQQIAHVSATDYEYQQWAVEAITAIKEALAQPEQDYKDLYEKEKRKSAMWLSKYEEVAGPAPKAIPMAQPEQEPVAWLHRFIEGGISIGLKPADLKRHPERWEPLYPEPKPCLTCESLARTVMLDQTSHDTTPLQRGI